MNQLSRLEQLPINIILGMLKNLDIADVSQLCQVSSTLRNSITPRYAGRLEGARLGKELKAKIAQNPSCQVSIHSNATEGSFSNLFVNLNTSDNVLLESVIDKLSKLPDLAELTIFTTHSIVAILQLASHKIDFDRLSQLTIVTQGAGITHLTDCHIGQLYQQLVLTFTADFNASELVDSMRSYFYNIRPFCLVKYAIDGVSIQFCHKQLVSYALRQSGKGKHNHKRNGSNSIVYFKDDRKRLRAA